SRTRSPGRLPGVRPRARRDRAECGLFSGPAGRWLRRTSYRHPGAHSFEQVVTDPQRVRHGREGRVHRANARKETRVHDVEVVDLVRAAVDVEHRGGRIRAEATGPGLV